MASFHLPWMEPAVPLNPLQERRDGVPCLSREYCPDGVPIGRFPHRKRRPNGTRQGWPEPVPVFLNRVDQHDPDALDPDLRLRYRRPSRTLRPPQGHFPFLDKSFQVFRDTAHNADPQQDIHGAKIPRANSPAAGRLRQSEYRTPLLPG